MTKKSLPDPVILPANTSIRLSNGHLFDPLNPDFTNVTIDVVAGALSNLCRFGGHLANGIFYSVAQHAVLVSHWCAPYELEGLHHDDTEGLGLVDLPRPVKYAQGMEVYRRYEQNLYEKWNAHLDLAGMPEAVKRADDQMLVAEMSNFSPQSHDYYSTRLKEQGYMEVIMDIKPWSAARAKEEYIYRHNYLTSFRAKARELSSEDGYPGVN
jgi:hypothetical protein